MGFQHFVASRATIPSQCVIISLGWNVHGEL